MYLVTVFLYSVVHVFSTVPPFGGLILPYGLELVTEPMVNLCVCGESVFNKLRWKKVDLKDVRVY